MDKRIQLTEDKLQELIENCVYNILMENDDLDEGIFGGLGNIGSKAANKVGEWGNKAAKSAKNFGEKAVNKVGEWGNKAAKSAKDFGNKVADAYREGSAAEDKKRAFNKCVRYYRQHSKLFAQANKITGQIINTANQYGFTFQDVQNAAKQ